MLTIKTCLTFALSLALGAVVAAAAPFPGAAPEAVVSVSALLERIDRYADDAVAVVVVHETFDRSTGNFRRTVREVWRGPASLVGKPMNMRVADREQAQNLAFDGERQSLLFLFATPTMTSYACFIVDGDHLKVERRITLPALRARLRAREAEP